MGYHNKQQETLLNCDQSNVLLTRIIFFRIPLKAFSFLSACIRDPASNWDLFNIDSDWRRGRYWKLYPWS